jgi:nicotinamide riboside kinase
MGLKHFFRSMIYPRTFDVTLLNPLTGETKRLAFRAIDKSEDRGRFTGPCVETITIHPEDFEANFGSEKKWRRVKRVLGIH